ncbi:MAG: hypothetical protein ACKVQU_05915 [Burkholderiales bacterium]
MDARIAQVWQRTLRILACWFIVLLLPLSSARADAISAWHAIAEQVIAASEHQPARAARSMATVSIAVFETMNFILGKYEPRFLVKPQRALGSSGEIEAIGAAHHVLTQLHPDRNDVLDTALDRFLAAHPNQDAALRARIWGRNLGGAVFASWSTDVHAQDASPPNISGHPKGIAPSGGPATHLLAWSPEVRRFIASTALNPIERARIYALTSSAANSVHVAAAATRDSQSAATPCVACAVAAAIQTVMEREFESAGLARFDLRTSTMRAEASTLRVTNTGTMNKRSIEASENLGKKLGMDALAFFRPVVRPFAPLQGYSIGITDR